MNCTSFALKDKQSSFYWTFRLKGGYLSPIKFAPYNSLNFKYLIKKNQSPIFGTVSDDIDTDSIENSGSYSYTNLELFYSCHAVSSVWF